MKCDRILICMSSKLRFFDTSMGSFLDNVVKQLPSVPDFVGHFPAQDETVENYKTFMRLSKYVKIQRLVFEKDMAPSQFSPEKFTDNINKGKVNQTRTMLGNFYQWHNMKRCADLKKECEDIHGKYDLVIWCRPDLYYFNKLEDLSKLPTGFYTIGHDNHLCGLNDRFDLGTSDQMQKRMNIGGYFVNEWYPKYSSDMNVLFSGKNVPDKNKNPQWNAEIVTRHFIQKKLMLKTNKLKLCFGKLRSDDIATLPYWFEVHGNDYTGKVCDEDLFQKDLYEKLNSYKKQGKGYEGASWGVLDINELKL